MPKASNQTSDTTPAPEAIESPAADATLVIDTRGTILETQTVVEDRTDHPELDVVPEYEAEETDLGNGTVLTSYGELKGE